MIEIYADVVFIINFLMDIFIFWIVSKLVKKKVPFLRLVGGGFVAALLFCVFLFVPKLQSYYNFFTMLLVLIAGIIVTFQPKKMLDFMKLILLSHIAAFCVGGMGIALFYFTNISNIIGNMVGFYVEDFSVKLLLTVSCTTYIIVKLSIGWFKRILVKKQKFFDINIVYDDYHIHLQALLDTGNSLHDPISESPVIVAEFNSIKNFLPNELKLIFYENKENDYNEVLTNIQHSNFARRIRMIPFTSLGKQNGMLLGFRPDKVVIENEEKKVTIDDVIIGIYNFKLSQDNSYQGLLNPEVLCVSEVI